MRRLPTTISEEDFLSKVKTVKNPKHRLALMLGFYQCMRVSEVEKLQPNDVDRGRGFLYLRQAKGNKDRHVPIMKPVLSGLRHLPIGIGIRALQKLVKRTFDNPQIHFHTLRHSGATMYLNDKEVDIRYIQQLLGHSRLDTTQIYTHVTPENLKNKYNEVWK